MGFLKPAKEDETVILCILSHTTWEISNKHSIYQPQHLNMELNKQINCHFFDVFVTKEDNGSIKCLLS